MSVKAKTVRDSTARRPRSKRTKQPKAQKVTAVTRNDKTVTGRDAELPEWLSSRDRPAERPKYDSAVIVGSGIGGLCCAARLARSQAFAGRVTILGKPPEQDRRLIGGLTLRARSLDYFGACLGISRATLLEAMYDGHADEVASNKQFAARFNREPNGRYSIGRRGEWMSRWEHDGRVLSYGVRNSHMAGVIHDFMDGMDITWVSDKSQSLSDCRAAAPGHNPVVINASPMPLPGAGGIPVKPERFVVAAQLPFATPRQREKGILPPNTSFFCGHRRNGALDASVWYPLRDPLSPTAGFYGIFYRIVEADSDLHKNAEVEVMKAHLHGVGEALGFEAVDPEETLGTAMVPCSDWRPIREHTPGYVPLAKLANAGTPIIAGDGIPRAALASYVTAEALIAGVEPQPYLNRAMAGWKRRNRLADRIFSAYSVVGDAALHWAPGFGLNLIQDHGETWAGLE